MLDIRRIVDKIAETTSHLTKEKKSRGFCENFRTRRDPAELFHPQDVRDRRIRERLLEAEVSQ